MMESPMVITVENLIHQLNHWLIIFQNAPDPYGQQFFNIISHKLSYLQHDQTLRRKEKSFIRSVIEFRQLLQYGIQIYQEYRALPPSTTYF